MFTPGTAFKLHRWICSSQSPLLIFGNSHVCIGDCTRHYPNHHVKSCLLLHPTPGARQSRASLNSAAHPRNSSVSAQLGYPHEPISKTKRGASVLHFDLRSPPAQFISSSLTPLDTQPQQVSITRRSSHLIFSLYFSIPSHIKKQLC